MDTDGTPWQTVGVAQGGHCADVDAGDGGTPEIDGDAVWLLVAERSRDALHAGGGCWFHWSFPV